MSKAILFLAAALLTALPCKAQRWNWSASHTLKNTAVTAPKSTQTEPASTEDDFFNGQEASLGYEDGEDISAISLILNKEDFDAADVDKDGKISEEEFLMFQENNFKNMAQENFSSYDSNHDGKITKEEIASYYSKTKENSENIEQISARFEQADIDSDNTLDESEFQHFLQIQMMQNNKALFSLFDANGDNAITYDEIEQFSNIFQNLQN